MSFYSSLPSCVSSSVLATSGEVEGWPEGLPDGAMVAVRLSDLRVLGGKRRKDGRSALVVDGDRRAVGCGELTGKQGDYVPIWGHPPPSPHPPPTGFSRPRGVPGRDRRTNPKLRDLDWT